MLIQKKIIQALFIFLMITMATTSFPESVSAQNKDQVIRLARLVIDSSQLEAYKAALKEGIEAAISKEPGVLTLYAVYEKEHPTHVTVFEIYANLEAYQTHIQTAHFKKYKSTTLSMVKSLELLDMAPIGLGAKSFGH